MGEVEIGICALITIVGGVVGIILSKKSNEHLISGSIFIVTGALILLFIRGFGEIAAILFIITGIVEIVLNERVVLNNTRWIYVVLLAVIPIILLLGITATGAIIDSKSVSITNVNQDISDNSGTFSGSLKGDVQTTKDFSSLTAKIVFYDESGKVISESYGLTTSNVKANQIYVLDGSYSGNIMPARAVVEFTSDFNSDPFYSQNIVF